MSVIIIPLKFNLYYKLKSSTTICVIYYQYIGLIVLVEFSIFISLCKYGLITPRLVIDHFVPSTYLSVHTCSSKNVTKTGDLCCRHRPCI